MPKHLSIAADLHKASFWEALVSAALVVANQGFGWHFNSTTVLTFSGLVIGLLVGQHILAAAHVRASSTTPTPGTAATPPTATDA